MKILKNIEEFTKKNKIEILTGLSISGVVITGVKSFKAGMRADYIVDDYYNKLNNIKINDKEKEKELKKETAKNLAPIVIPPMIFGAGTIASIIASTKSSSNKIAVLTAGYAMADKAAKELNDKLVEVVGEKKASEIKGKILEDKIKKNPPSQETVKTQLICSGDGNTLCFDEYSGRYFRSSPDKIHRAITKLSANLISEMYVSLNDFYDEINAPGLDRIPMGDQFGWNIDNSSIGLQGTIPITLSSILTEEDIPCLCLSYSTEIREDYKSLH